MKIKVFLNSEIIKITNRINDSYPELSKYVGEMRTTIAADKNLEVSVESLSQYYDSLNSLLNNYIRDHSAAVQNEHAKCE